ncbi:MAG: hemolysin family protein [Elusimicrobia bacterium]|nr:hemolysin family protein [Candidatus Liberimonas magnetica]
MLIFSGSVVIILLFLLSAFWSGSEIALTSLSKYRIKKIIALKKSLSGPLKQWLKSPYYLLTTILVGNTITNLTLSFFATVLVLHAFLPSDTSSNKLGIFGFITNREFLEFVVWISITFLLLIFGEVTPKIYCRSNPEKITFFALPVLSRIANIFIPLIWPVKQAIRLIFPKAELFPVGKMTALSMDETKELIREAGQSGMLAGETSQMLERVLKLGDFSIDKIMTTLDKVEAVNIDQSQERFLDLIVETGRSRVPVYHTSVNRIAGFIHTKDLLELWQGVSEIEIDDLIRPPYFVSKNKKIYDLMKELQSGRTHMAFVTDEMENLVGVVTLEDILEEIVGEILDEYDLKEKNEQ